MENLYSVFFIFGLGGLAYFVLIPLEMYIKGNEYFFVHYWIKLGSYERNVILLMSILSLFGFFFGLKLSRYQLLSGKSNIKNNDVIITNENYWWSIKLLIVIILICGLVLFICYRDLFLYQWDYSSAYGITYESPLYSFLKTHLLIALGMLACLIKHRGWKWNEKIICFGMVVLIVIVGLLTSDKEPLLLALLTCGSFIEFKKSSFKRFIAISFFGSASVIALVLFFNLYRTHMPLKEIFHHIPLTSISFTKLDPAGPMVTFGTVIEDNASLKYGITYINSMGVIVPKAIWHNRPISLSEEFARNFFAEYREGMGVGYSPLTESFLNYHIPGAFIHFLIFGLLIGFILQLLKNKIFINHDKLLTSFIYILVYYIIIMNFRSPLIGPIKLSLQLIVPYCILLLSLKYIKRISR